MKGIESLIKLHKFELDEKRRTLKELETAQANIVGAIDALETQIINEQNSARISEVVYAYGAFADASIKRREALQQSLAVSTREVEAARDVVTESFGELKKYEITKAARDRALEQEANRREGIFLDELGITVHSRKNNS
ncbi:MAG: flagellar FliJ family protein [Rhodospirillaceae bacterium]|jgi:flagellar export protein FliJ|nr:flagellar FliJ family protein [Rhodospirillaceae bacterium]MBT5664381.1 flagellar FliJ family protein [Rhodospirillaceae bacterium]MBT5810805.1 flagellar FliJ family protein [Rhodospirillaceae bacterium]